MDKKQILEEAKATIDNINAAQATLDEYLLRLKHLVEKLELETLKKEQLTMADVVNIQNNLKDIDSKVNIEDDEKVSETDTLAVFDKSEEEIVEIKSKSKNGFLVNGLIFLGVIALSLSLFLTVKKVNPNFKLFNHFVYNYSESNMEPLIESNSLVIIRKLAKQEEVIIND